MGQGMCVVWCVFRRGAEERVSKLKLEVEALSQSEQTAAKSQAVEKEQVTLKYVLLSTWSIKYILLVVNNVSINNLPSIAVILFVGQHGVQ